MAAAETREADALPPELAELAGLAAAADAQLNEAQQPPGQALATVPTLAQNGEALAAMLQSLVLMAEPVAPYLKVAYTDEACGRIGMAVAAVAEKRGWNLSAMTDSPELMLAVVAIPPSITAYKQAQLYYAWKARQEEQAQQQQQQARSAPAPVDGS